MASEDSDLPRVTLQHLSHHMLVGLHLLTLSHVSPLLHHPICQQIDLSWSPIQIAEQPLPGCHLTAAIQPQFWSF